VVLNDALWHRRFGADPKALSASLARQYPGTDRGWSLRVAGAR